MVSKPIPTRSEIDEIAYNIQNGVDALMLSDESAI
jgi:pyruvate kinase